MVLGCIIMGVVVLALGLATGVYSLPRQVAQPVVCLFSSASQVSEADSAWTDVPPATRPAVQVAGCFSSHMVIQREMEAPVWGTANPGQRVTLSFAGQTHSTTADAKGQWMVRLAPLAAGGPHEMRIEAGEAQTVLEDVLVGDVWICAGQSNMDWPLKATTGGDGEASKAEYPAIRLSSNAQRFQGVGGRSWVRCSPEAAAQFSAVGYYFGRQLHADLKVPIGLISRCVGGTVIRQWAPRSGKLVEADPRLAVLRTDFQLAARSYEAARQTYRRWWEAARVARKNGLRVPVSPPVPVDPRSWGSLFDSHILPLVPMAIKGVAWYQGETDARYGRHADQRRALPAMVRAWRKAWGQGDFPFLVVQLADDWGGQHVRGAPPVPATPPKDQYWPWVREAQAQVLGLPHTGLAVTLDLGGPMHFPNKHDVGYRLALVAQGVVYKKEVVYSGPQFQSFRAEGNKLRLSFRDIAGGLVVRGGQRVMGFAVAGSDQRFVWADGVIEGDTVVLWSPQVQQPVAARYGWLDDPHGNLYNRQGLPAAPFRTDNWPEPEPTYEPAPVADAAGERLPDIGVAPAQKPQ